MTTTAINRNALLPYTAKEMFELVDAIETYPAFLPSCSDARILSRVDNEVEATIGLSWGGVRKSFTTKNTLTPYQEIKLSLVEGPFRRLDGAWRFVDVDQQCMVHLDLEFELTGHFLDRFIQPIFYQMANSFVDVFAKRAIVVYGHR